MNIGLNRYEYYQFFITLFYLISGLKWTASFAVEKKPYKLNKIYLKKQKCHLLSMIFDSLFSKFDNHSITSLKLNLFGLKWRHQ